VNLTADDHPTAINASSAARTHDIAKAEVSATATKAARSVTGAKVSVAGATNTATAKENASTTKKTKKKTVRHGVAVATTTATTGSTSASVPATDVAGNGRAKDTLPSGAVRQPDGSVVFPSTVRADGSVRKERRVKAGFLPPDQQARYETVPARVSVALVVFSPGLCVV
jgi:hypothetical protein